ncbi:carboxypeptidase regulatory-like domain-containing protein [Variovorax sp. DXTD-1]|uniref:carboxypeptidase regulatory-like domain-containing protein n=1 Tax=Variovorax sp. DXTD-1 TaxID=2495592 RepID=UPI000F86262F|nr:carboxypeptidase regulatory-like domain-containing protein [Variovorax sp. DXTD-1]RST50307.1 carboxypeptidase regulatory-like domain-containing protein [Variovorax sp. DXTD-1]
MSSVQAFIVQANLRRALLALACATAAVGAQAQSAMPQWKGEGAVRYVCGGIGSDESNAMRAAMKEHPLALLFARSDGAYLADVQVDIKGAAGAPSLALRASGPVCLVDLPAGRYTVDAATAGGSVQSQSVTVGGSPKTASFRF